MDQKCSAALKWAPRKGYDVRDGACKQDAEIRDTKLGLLVLSVKEEAWRRRGTKSLAAEIEAQSPACLIGMFTWKSL